MVRDDLGVGVERAQDAADTLDEDSFDPTDVEDVLELVQDLLDGIDVGDVIELLGGFGIHILGNETRGLAQVIGQRPRYLHLGRGMRGREGSLSSRRLGP